MHMYNLHLVVLALLYICEPSYAFRYNYVTCGSAIKLQNVYYQTRLHSHEVQYGTGSGQQSVTGVDKTDDVNSHWVIKGAANKSCIRGEPVNCGVTIRLEHLATKRNLHSHLFKSPLSRGQEVSAFGSSGEGDTGDNWAVVCDGESWSRDDNVMLKHVDTGMYLAVSGQTYGHPIGGQMEVYAISGPDSGSQWKVAEGVFIKPSEFKPHPTHTHTEL